jgi:hypothetical protein
MAAGAVGPWPERREHGSMGEVRTVCAVCGVIVDGIEALAEHLVAEAAGSDIAHVMWLNRTVTKHRVAPAELAVLLRRQGEGRATGSNQVAR